MIHLLTHGPLCVCHFQDILEIPQTKVSQHLAYLRKRALVETTRRGTWIIYSLPTKPPAELEANLKCLQDCVQTDAQFRKDLERRNQVTTDCGWMEALLEDKRSCSC